MTLQPAAACVVAAVVHASNVPRRREHSGVLAVDICHDLLFVLVRDKEPSEGVTWQGEQKNLPGWISLDIRNPVHFLPIYDCVSSDV